MKIKFPLRKVPLGTQAIQTRLSCARTFYMLYWNSSCKFFEMALKAQIKLEKALYYKLFMFIGSKLGAIFDVSLSALIYIQSLIQLKFETENQLQNEEYWNYV